MGRKYAARQTYPSTADLSTLESATAATIATGGSTVWATPSRPPSANYPDKANANITIGRHRAYSHLPLLATNRARPSQPP